MPYAVVADRLVINVVEWDGESLWAPPDGTSLIEDPPSGVSSGWKWVEGEWVPPDAPIPSSVSPRQLKLALLVYGLLDDVEAFVDAAGRAVQIAWANTTEYERQDPMLNQMIAAFGMEPETADELFRFATTL
jgi:hypothetical protein